MDQSTSPQAGSFDVRTSLLEFIGNREDGISRQELMRKMNGLTKWRSPFYYEATLGALVEEGRVDISHCGMENHKTRVYSLAKPDQYKKTCRVCQLTKSAAAFRRRHDSKDGYTNQCKLCENQQRKDKGWANKSRRRRQVEARMEAGEELGVSMATPMVVLEKEEVDARVAATKIESLDDHRQKYHGMARYIDVNGKAVPAPGRELSPVEEYDRAWRRIKQIKRNSG